MRVYRSPRAGVALVVLGVAVLAGSLMIGGALLAFGAVGETLRWATGP